MAQKPAIRVALDLETTGLHPEQDAILEIAAVKFQGNEVIDTFETFVAPGRSIPYRVQRLTGIKPEHLQGAPSFSSVAKKLQSFLGELPLVGHSIPFDAGFLRVRGLARVNPLIDTFELATVLLPSMTSYNLGHVAEVLGVRVPQDRHRAMVDTVLAMEVFQALHARLAAVDISLLNDLANLDAPRSWPLLHFFRQELRERQSREGVHGTLARGSLGERFAAQLGMDPRVLSFAISPQRTTSEVAPSVVPEDVILPAPVQPPVRNYEVVHRAVLQALEQRTPLLAELLVGGHDYTPVLRPTLEWLQADPQPGEARRRLVIACVSQQSARRLIEITLPQVQKELNTQLSVAYLAERGGYLCTHRWFGAALRRTSGELTAEQARGLAKLGLWAQQTLSGERGELNLLQQEAAAWDRISSGVERIPSSDKRGESSYQQCTYRRKGYCFVSLAEERVNAAQIVVTTHAGLFDDLSQNNHSLLRTISARVILDTALLEEENARWNNTELDQARLLRTLNTIGAELPDGRYQGLLALAAPALRENGPGGLSTTPTISKAELDARTLTWFQTLRQARTAVEKVFTNFAQLVEEYMQQNVNGKGRGDGAGRSHGSRMSERADQPLRLTGQLRQLSAWTETERAWQQCAQRLQAVIDLTAEAEKLILASQRQRRRLDLGGGEDGSVAAEFIATGHQLLEYRQLGQKALTLGESDHVYWLRMPPTPLPSPQTQRQHDVAQATTEATPVLYAQLMHTSVLLKRTLLAQPASTIFAGPGLSADNSFAFIRERLGLEEDFCPSVSAVDEHHEQTLLYLPNDVPEPNAPQYQRHLDEALIQLASALDGQVVALFTSHAALRSSYAAIKPLLEARNILVLGQGVDGSPRQLWQTFRSQERVIVLGTGSFWDGIDDIACPPTCLFIARLPMPVLNDPPVAARAEHYSDQLHQFTVPIAALRIKRALDRLVWSDRKRNAIVLFDRRVISKEYGSLVLHSLPRVSQRQGGISHMPETILDWLTDTGGWESNLP